MQAEPAYSRAAHAMRPYSTHRFDVYSPKLQRPIVLFGLDVLRLWILIESDPTVLEYCERPIILENWKPKCGIDFWVGRLYSQEFLTLKELVPIKQDNAKPVGTSLAKLDCLDDIPVRLIDTKEFDSRKLELENWGTIIRDVSAFSRYVSKQLLESILAAAHSPVQLSGIEESLDSVDPILVRVAAFTHMLRGTLICKSLKNQRLSGTSVIGIAANGL